MQLSRTHRASAAVLAVLALAAGLLVLVEVAGSLGGRDGAVARDTGVLVAMLLSGGALIRRGRQQAAWRTTPFMAAGVLALAAVNAVFLVQDLQGAGVYTSSPADLAFLPVAALFLIPVGIEFVSHLKGEQRREIVIDVALITAASTCAVWLMLRPLHATAQELVSSLVFSAIAVGAFTGYGALAVWIPSRAHLGLLSVMTAFSGATLAFGAQWVRGTYTIGQPGIDLAFGIGALALAALMTALPRRPVGGPGVEPSRWGRSLLTAIAVTTACFSLWVVAFEEHRGRIGPNGALTIIGLIAAAIAVRILVNQVRSTSATGQARRALEQKEEALQETERVMASLTRANDTLRASEERLRLLFEAAVDGVVELEGEVIVRANEAFCRMVDLPYRQIEQRTWEELAATVEGADASFASLPTTAQATLRREGHAFYVEARISEIPGDPVRRLLLLRDVTAARVADQTIRSLFKFLQDRDEDRTRLLRRTNAAIEAERNRIARDLHDGPVQGVSAASLSLEAVLLMLRAGDVEEGVSVLSKVRGELSEEADNLRRLMTGLRPPLLEERGLVPAIRDTLEKFGLSSGVETSFTTRSLVEVPYDLETLAYRIVQEALSNAGKHSGARSISVTVEAVAGQLRVEITDDGAGFDATRTREFLEMGRVGLASMRERVELASGTFMVHSTPGKGTTILATLPLEAVPAPRELAAN